MESELHLPWDNEALQALLLKMVKTGEATKVDFKRQLNIANADHHAELLKDISAMANAHDHHYRNHAFLVLGVSGNELSFTSFDQNADALQARIDELVKTYIEPFVPTQVRIFEDLGRHWGVIVIPPTRSAPHVFVRDLAKRSRGEIFVRRGTTTEKAMPTDFARFFRLHLDESTYELRQDVNDLRREVAALKRERPAVPMASITPKTDAASAAQSLPQTAVKPANLIEAIESSFPEHEDPISKGLASEARKIRAFLKSSAIPWGYNHVETQTSKKILDDIEVASSAYWSALGALMYRDDNGKYDEAIIRSLSHLLHVPEAPSGTSYTDWGINVRYLPLVVSLYIVSMFAATRKRYGLLKRIFELRLASRSRYEESTPFPRVLFHLRRSEPIFQSQNPNYPNQRWCDAVGMWIDKAIERQVVISDEDWDRRAAFFLGEFVLALSPLAILDEDTGTPAIGHPSAGLYLYYSEASPIIRRFLKSEAKPLGEIFKRPLRDVLSDFDRTATKLISPGCWGDGFSGGAVSAAFPEPSKKPE